MKAFISRMIGSDIIETEINSVEELKKLYDKEEEDLLISFDENGINIEIRDDHYPYE